MFYVDGKCSGVSRDSTVAFVSLFDGPVRNIATLCLVLRTKETFVLTLVLYV